MKIGDEFIDRSRRVPEHYRVVNIHDDGDIVAVLHDEKKRYPDEWPTIFIYPVPSQVKLEKI